MKRYLILLALINAFATFAIAQQTTDNVADTTAILQSDSIAAEDDSIYFSTQKFIDNLSQLPAQQYYNQDWSEEHIRLKTATIPFVNDSIILFLNKKNFIFPVKNWKVISEYGVRHGRMHTGTDIKQRLNDTVVSCFDGVVRLARPYSGYGNVVVVRHPNGLESVYSHLNKIKVKPKQIVKAGQMVGLAGRTGRATTEHLHFEFRFLYEHFNTRHAIDYDSEKLISDTLILTPKMLNRKSSNSTTAPTQEERVSPEERPDYHTIKKGDTLYKISRIYGISVKELLKLNNIKEDSILSLGQKIKLK